MRSPNPGLFPPARPRKRRPWFDALLTSSAKLRCISRKGRHNRRMLKRRNSPYASHDRSLARNVKTNFSPQLLAPRPVAPRQTYEKLVYTNSIGTCPYSSVHLPFGKRSIRLIRELRQNPRECSCSSLLQFPAVPSSAQHCRRFSASRQFKARIETGRTPPSPRIVSIDLAGNFRLHPRCQRTHVP